MNRNIFHSAIKRNSGFTIVELMVALVIGLIISLGALQLFLTTKSSFRTIERIYERQSILDYLHDVISQEVRIANGPVYPASGGGVVSDSDNLLITLDESIGLDYDPYCGDNILEAVEYHSSGADVLITYECEDSTDPSLKTKYTQTIATGIDGLHFFGDTASSASRTIDAEVSFIPFPGEAADDAKFSFKVTNRKEVVDSF